MYRKGIVNVQDLHRTVEDQINEIRGECNGQLSRSEAKKEEEDIKYVKSPLQTGHTYNSAKP